MDDGAWERILHTVRNTNEKLEGIIKRMDEGDHNVLVSGNEAARLLGVSSASVSKMIKQHRLTKVTIGCSTGIRLSEVKKAKKPL